MEFEIIDNCPVPKQLAPVVAEIKRQTGATLNSCDRSPEAEPFLKRCTPPKHSQRELFDGFQKHLPGFRPANRPGQSTHERRNDGVAYRGPVGMPLRYWQVGMDWQDSERVIEVANKLGFTAHRTYPTSALEVQHVNFIKEPRIAIFQPLKRGAKGYRVARMAKQLASLRDGQGKPYLDAGQGIFDQKLEQALERFQHDWGQKPDGVYGVQTARQLAIPLRHRKQQQKAQPAHAHAH